METPMTLSWFVDWFALGLATRAASTMVADRYATLPVELRLLALGLPLSETLRVAA
jgi:hypothetical protein